MYSDPLGAAGPSIMGLAAKGAGVHPTQAELQGLIGGFARRIPAPGSAALLALGLVALGFHKLRLSRSQKPQLEPGLERNPFDPGDPG